MGTSACRRWHCRARAYPRRCCQPPHPWPCTAQPRACGHAACVGVIAYFLRGDLAARDKQIARISREESLAGLRLQLASGKTLPLGRLRSFCRPVMFYGSAEQVAAALEAAAPFKDELLRRGVFIVPLPLRGGDASDGLPALDKDDKESARCAALGTAPLLPPAAAPESYPITREYCLLHG